MTAVLKVGDRGSQVRELQLLLNRVARPCLSLRASGRFGIKTKAAVEALQRAHGLEVDGVVGPETWRRLGVSRPPRTRLLDTGSTHDWMAIAEAEGEQILGASLSVAALIDICIEPLRMP